MKFDYAILDLDSVLHIVAHKQYAAGNRDNHRATKNNVYSFIDQVKKGANAEKSIGFYQKAGHKNFRNEILPEYKGHRTTRDAIACWKPTIIEAFQESNLFGLSYIESDDAASYLADVLGYEGVIVVSADKDIAQIPVPVYNPFKAGLKPENRWSFPTREDAELLLWSQILTGDPTDMPGAMCGIEGCGPATAKKLLAGAEEGNYLPIVQRAYTEKYGAEEGFKRANLTYKMVRLLRYSESNPYINTQANSELSSILANYKKHFEKPKDDVKNLFNNYQPSVRDLFN